MKKYFSLYLCLFFFWLTPVLAEDFKITGKNVILYNLNDNEILYEKSSEEKTSIASLTKMMTAIVAIENIDNLESVVTVKEKDFEGTTGYSKAGFKVGDQVTYLDLLYGVLLPSGADAVNAIVNNTLGYDKFIEAMNDLAQKIGLTKTSFSNPVGKDDKNNYSTARDIATLVKYAIQNETFKMIFTTKNYTTSNGLELESTLNSYKAFLDIPKIDGAKSGFTKEAGRCLASITTLNGVNYLLVVINSSTNEPYNAVLDTLNIYEYYDSNYSYQTIIDDDTIIKEIPVKWSKENSYTITGNEEIKKYLKNDTNKNLTYKYEGIEEIKINTKKDTELGTVSIYNDTELLAKYPVFLEASISYYHPIIWLLGALLLAIVVIVIILRKRKRRLKKRKKR